MSATKEELEAGFDAAMNELKANHEAKQQTTVAPIMEEMDVLKTMSAGLNKLGELMDADRECWKRHKNAVAGHIHRWIVLLGDPATLRSQVIAEMIEVERKLRE